ncbi:hypothetical protein V6N13_055430 [Hibiscus sabdariffa]
MGGDFNIVCKTEERVGVSIKRGEMREFSEFIDAHNLIDPPLSGGVYTWSNFRKRPALSRLDRFLISPEVLIDWPDIVQRLMPKNISDHNPVSISMVKLN